MRLTLRTMLAYLDNVLEPADAEVLGKKINESDFASSLVQRVKAVMKKVRMDAPRLDGKGMGNDANTVSEYLDSALPQDRVGDFERVCLESDKHLCEVAAAHQVLTLVLGKPADVPIELRERIYAMGHPESQAALKSAAAVTPPPIQTAVKANGQAVKSAPAEVPEYLRAGRRPSALPFLATVAASFLVVAAGLWMMGAFKPSSALMRWMRGGPLIADNPAPVNPPTKANTEAVSTPAAGTPSTPATETTQTPPGATTQSPSGDAAAAALNVSPLPAVPAVPAGDVVPMPMPAVPASPAATENAVAAAPLPAVPAAAAPLPAIPPPDTITVADAGGKTSRRPLVPPGPEVKPVPMDVGRYTSDGQVLATLDSAGLWKLKPALGALVSGERLIALPTYRPQLTLPGVQVTFAGEGEAEMAPPSEGNISKLIVDHGKLLVVAVGAMGSQIDLDLGGTPGFAGVRGLVTLVDADSALAVKVMRWLPPGADPAEGPGAIVVELFNTHGRVTWQEPGQAKVEIPTHQAYVYAGANPPELQGPFLAPDWIDAKSIPLIDRQPAMVLEGVLTTARPLSVSLQESLQDRRVEVRSLAARCLSSLIEYEPLVKELGDNRITAFPYWDADADMLRRALHHSPDRAALVKATIERLRAADAKEIYQLIRGFSQEDLERGGAAQLVKLLEHEQLDVRVLAYYNLLAITGASEFYSPHKAPAQQRPAIQNWKERLSKGTIAYKLPPTPLENYKPLVNAAAAEVPLPPRGTPAVAP
jgi:hypothetical protein